MGLSSRLNVKIFLSAVSKDLEIMPVVLVELLDLWGGDVPEVVEGGFGVRDSLLDLLLPLLHLFRLVLVSLSCFRPGRGLVLMADFYSEKKKTFCNRWSGGHFATHTCHPAHTALLGNDCPRPEFQTWWSRRSSSSRACNDWSSHVKFIYRWKVKWKGEVVFVM